VTLTKEQLIEAAEKYIEYIKGLPDEKEPEVFEAELAIWREKGDQFGNKFKLSYGTFKFVETNEDRFAEPGDMIRFLSDKVLIMKTHNLYPIVDFATNAERERFEQVKLAMSREGQRFEGRRSPIHSNSAPEDAVFEYTGEFRPCPTVEWHEYHGEAYYRCSISPVHILRLVSPKLELKKDWLYWDKKLDRPFRYIDEEGPKSCAEKHPDERLRPATLDDLAVELDGFGKAWAWHDSMGYIRIGNKEVTLLSVKNNKFSAVLITGIHNTPLICKEQADVLGLN